MDHWEFTEEIKIAARKRRRHEAKRQVTEALLDLPDNFENDSAVVDRSDEGRPPDRHY